MCMEDVRISSGSIARYKTATADATGTARIPANRFRIAIAFDGGAGIIAVYFGPVAQAVPVLAVSNDAGNPVSGVMTYHSHPGIVKEEMLITGLGAGGQAKYVEVELGVPFDSRLKDV